jgi:hypothetical protein
VEDSDQTRSHLIFDQIVFFHNLFSKQSSLLEAIVLPDYSSQKIRQRKISASATSANSSAPALAGERARENYD